MKDFAPGDKVVVPAITPDWRSIEVQRGFPQHSGGPLAGWKYSNIKDGVFGELFHVNDADMNLAILPEDIPLESAVMITDMMTTGIHGAELADIGIGDTVIVFGIGPVGLMAVAGARLRGASRILVTGTRPKCVEVAKLYGATHVINYKIAPVDEQVLEITNGAGVDVAIIAGGNPDTLATAVKNNKTRGNISNVNYFGEGDILPIPRLEWGCGMAHKTIRGGLCPGGRLRMEKLIELVRYGRVDRENL